MDTTSGQLGGISEEGDCASAVNPGASLLQGPLSGEKGKILVSYSVINLFYVI